MEAVNNGTDIANRTAQALVETVESAGTVVTYVDDISTSAEQAESIFRYVRGVDQIAGIVRQIRLLQKRVQRRVRNCQHRHRRSESGEVFNLRKDSVYAATLHLFIKNLFIVRQPRQVLRHCLPSGNLAPTSGKALKVKRYEWDESLETGNQLIDSQHKNLSEESIIYWKHVPWGKDVMKSILRAVLDGVYR